MNLHQQPSQPFVETIKLDNTKFVDDSLKFVFPTTDKNVINVITGYVDSYTKEVINLIRSEFNTYSNQKKIVNITNYLDYRVYSSNVLNLVNCVHNNPINFIFNKTYSCDLAKELEDYRHKFETYVDKRNSVSLNETFPIGFQNVLDMYVKLFNKFFSCFDLPHELQTIDERGLVFINIEDDKIITYGSLSDEEKFIYNLFFSIFYTNCHYEYKEIRSCSFLIDLTSTMPINPDKQINLINKLRGIGSSNQFIIATHSPYIVSNLTPEDHLIVLNFDERKNITINYNPKFIERDINTTIDVMGYSHQLPPHVLELREKYREYFDKNEEQTEQCLEIKRKLLQYETLESSFFQEIEFLKALRK